MTPLEIINVISSYVTNILDGVNCSTFSSLDAEHTYPSIMAGLLSSTTVFNPKDEVDLCGKKRVGAPCRMARSHEKNSRLFFCRAAISVTGARYLTYNCSTVNGAIVQTAAVGKR